MLPLGARTESRVIEDFQRLGPQVSAELSFLQKNLFFISCSGEIPRLHPSLRPARRVPKTGFVRSCPFPDVTLEFPDPGNLGQGPFIGEGKEKEGGERGAGVIRFSEAVPPKHESLKQRKHASKVGHLSRPRSRGKRGKEGDGKGARRRQEEKKGEQESFHHFLPVFLFKHSETRGKIEQDQEKALRDRDFRGQKSRAAVATFLFFLKGRGNGGCRTLEVDALDAGTYVVAVAHEVAEVFARDLGLGLGLQRGFALLLQRLDAALKALTQLVGRVLERAADLGADALRVGVRVVELRELGGEFGAEAAGQRMWDLRDGVGDSEDSW
nr:hypothetical protein CFP56_03025 [Quercus suber]